MRARYSGRRHGSREDFPILALIFHNRQSEVEAAKTTLLVVPAGAVTMWKANLKMFPELSHIEYNTHNKDDVDVKDLVRYDVVLSTYNLIARQYQNLSERDLDIKAALQGKTTRSVRLNRSTYEKQLDTHLPWAPLYSMAFHCVILDEAHRIRNKRSGQFKAMLKLKT